jgi:hypothetical protein
MSAVSKDELPKVLSELNETNTWGLKRFADPEYLHKRILVERIIRKQFIAKGGSPALNYPIYFFLGKNTQFESHKDNRAYLIKIKDLPENVVSFTYGDSMFSLDEDYRRMKGGPYLSELCNQVYTLGDLPKIYSHMDYQSPLGLHIEAQLWITPSDASFSRCD